MFNHRDTLYREENGQLMIGGISAEALAKEFGTPLYVYDQKYIEDICKEYKAAISSYGQGLVKYASKAFCCKEIYRIVNAMDMGIDIVSGGELCTAMSVDFPAEKIYFHGNNKSQKEIEMAIKYGVKRFVVDSISEIQHLDSLASKKLDVMLRVNPGVEAHTHHFIQTAKLDSKFGLAIEKGFARAGVEAILRSENLRLAGLHCHIGSQIFEMQAFSVAANKMMDFIYDLKVSLGITIDELNMGGGYGIWYCEGDKKMQLSDYAEFVQTIVTAIDSKCSSFGLKKPFLSIEPGRSIVGEAGITLYTVGNIKDITGIKKYVSIDGGMFENPRYALYQAKYTAAVANDKGKVDSEKVTLTGKCCESGDMIICDITLPNLSRGDVLAVFSTGAYNHSMSSNYNKNPRPAVVGVMGGVPKLWVKGETYDDLTQNDI